MPLLPSPLPSSAAYIDAFNRAGVPHARINDYAAALADPQTAHPFYWAPFNLIGNWRLTVGQ